MIATITFTDLAYDRTQVDIEQKNVPVPMMDPGAQIGFRTSLDRFGAHLAQLRAADR